MFKLSTISFRPKGDQQRAIERLVEGIEKNYSQQVLLGVTGSGKTFTIANVIERVQKPTLVISHNKTLAAQLYQEFKEFFPDNSVNYFVSYYDYYQPESYLPATDTYIEKETEINKEIDKLRLAATTNLLTRRDVIIVASVSCIYNLGSPQEYKKATLAINKTLSRRNLLERLVALQYERSDFDFRRGTFRVRGENVDIFPSYDDFGVRVGSEIIKFDTLTGKELEKLDSYVVYPAKHYMTDPSLYSHVFAQIRKDKEIEVENLKKNNKVFEAHRLNQRVDYDLEMIQELGYVNGIENYSRYFDGRAVGAPPFSLLDYFPKDYLLVIDESHMTIPQIRGMYNGDRSRKETLINYGFRLKAAYDNRPLRFEEFLRLMGQTIYVSATPDEWELSCSQQVVEQLVRPTGIVDPQITVRKTAGQIEDLISEIKSRVNLHQRVLVTTLTKRLAEELAEYLEEQTKIKVAYLHSDVKTLERTKVLEKLRLGEYDVLIGVNLLREGLDLPEVTLVAILDADKEGFLRSRSSLIQTMGRAARNIDSKVIMYADKVTNSMQSAIDEVARRRKYQLEFNKKNNIIPTTIVKAVRAKFAESEKTASTMNYELQSTDNMTPEQKNKYKKKLEKLMRAAAASFDFERAIHYREKIKELFTST
jgi:excinuclease ABC subunit B